MSQLNSHELLQLYRAGQSQAAAAIFDRYVVRLVALARSRLGTKLRRRLDAEDIVQSAYHSFFLHAKGDDYELSQPGDLWRLLAKITLNKLYRQIEKQTAARRSLNREEPSGTSLANAIAPEPSAAEVIAVVEELQLVVDGLAPNQQQVLTLMLSGRSLEEISALIGKSERTTRRMLAEVKHKIELRLASSERDAPIARPFVIEPHAPLRYSDYVLEQLLGQGGMGKVFRAREKCTGKLVAIKTLHKRRQSNERAVVQFLQEAQILARLRHPNIVGVQGIGRFPGGGYFIVMDFVDGLDLQARQDQKQVTPGEATRIVKEVALAIQHAHDQGVVHCDLKPGNILLDKSNRVFVTDFGLAFLVTETSGRIGGTAGYVAPEILLRHSRPTPAADVFGLGMLLWTLTTGKSPTNLNLQHAADDPLAHTYSVCRRCLATDPNDRYRSLKEMIRDLQAT